MILEPRPSTPVGLIVGAGFLALLGFIGLSIGTFERSWWLVLPLWGLAAFQVWAAVRKLLNQKRLLLEITPERLFFADVAANRAEVTRIHAHKALLFHGVRVDLGPGRWLGIPLAHHDPVEVLRAFRTQRYPVDDGFSSG